MPKKTAAQIIADHLHKMRSNGGKATKAKYSKAERVEAAKRAANARWEAKRKSSAVCEVA